MVSRTLRDLGVEEQLLHTGQHYDPSMSEIFFAELEIPAPRHNLGIGSGPHGAQTGRMLQACEQVLESVKPACVLVYGDTNSTLAGALAAAKLHIPVAHVEAGLRSFNRRMPEEINRVLTDHVSELLFAPTVLAVENLRREGIQGERVSLVGDVMYDAALHFASIAASKSSVLAKLRLTRKQFVLATVHRAENTEDQSRLRAIVNALSAVVKDTPVVWPVHPRTRAILDRLGLTAELGNIKIVEPVGYLDMVALESNAAVIATDSGGVQKEAFFHRVPCVTLRDETEWKELVDLGWNRLSPPINAHKIETDIRNAFNSAGEIFDPYGGGKASSLIAEQLHTRLN